MHGQHGGAPCGESFLVPLGDPTCTPSEVAVSLYIKCRVLPGSGPHVVGVGNTVHGVQGHKALLVIRRRGGVMRDNRVGQNVLIHARALQGGGGGNGRRPALVVSIVGGLVSKVRALASGLGGSLLVSCRPCGCVVHLCAKEIVRWVFVDGLHAQ